MRNNKSFIFQIRMVLIFLVFSNVLLAQNFEEIIRLSQYSNTTSARNMGVGGTMGSIGSDISAFHATNPAGIAAFRNNDLSLSPSYLNVSNAASLSGTEIDRSEGSMGFDAIGVVVDDKVNNPEKISIAFGLSYSKLKSFKNEFFFTGKTRGSITDRFVENSNGINRDDLYLFEEGIAYEALAIYEIDLDDLIYTSDILDKATLVDKNQLRTEKGSLSELALGLGVMVHNKVNIGLVLGIPFYSYESFKRYEEKDPENEIPVFDNLIYSETLSGNGVGVNLRLGVNYKVTKFWTVGLGVQTPTAFAYNENFSTKISYSFVGGEGSINETPLETTEVETESVSSSYSVKSPFRASFNSSYIFKAKGFINAEIELVDYGSGKFDFSQEDGSNPNIEDEIKRNDEIREVLKTGINFKLGGEMVIEKKYRLRAGIQLNGSPFANDNTITPTYSLGTGLSLNGFYMDLGYNLVSAKSTYSPYVADSNEFPIVDLKSNRSHVLLTLGVRF